MTEEDATREDATDRSFRPVIAVVAYHLAPDRVTRWPEGGYGVPALYIDSLRAAGARIVLLPPGEEGDPETILEAVDGLLLVGGGDVSPSRYAGDPDEPHTYGVEPDRDAFEIALLEAAVSSATPTLCICRGVQVLNVAYGGTLQQHLPDVPGLVEHGPPIGGTPALHDVDVEPTSRVFALTKSSKLACLSHHHQAIDNVGEGLEVTGRSADGLIEAVELVVEDRDTLDAPWVVGVQWHPEETAGGDPLQQALFDGFVLLARARASRAGPGEARGRSRDFEIVEPDPAWRERFRKVAEDLSTALGSLPVRIEHIGSTSVPGLAAKDVIDVAVALPSMEPRDAYSTPLRAFGFSHKIDPWDPEHEFFGRGWDDDYPFKVNVHVCLAGGAFERRHLAFRDWLREHPEDVQAYARLKLELATDHPNDIQSYTEGKTAFIREVEARALASRATADT